MEILNTISISHLHIIINRIFELLFIKIKYSYFHKVFSVSLSTITYNQHGFIKNERRQSCNLNSTRSTAHKTRQVPAALLTDHNSTVRIDMDIRRTEIRSADQHTVRCVQREIQQTDNRKHVISNMAIKGRIRCYS